MGKTTTIVPRKNATHQIPSKIFQILSSCQKKPVGQSSKTCCTKIRPIILRQLEWEAEWICSWYLGSNYIKKWMYPSNASEMNQDWKCFFISKTAMQSEQYSQGSRTQLWVPAAPLVAKKATKSKFGRFVNSKTAIAELHRGFF